MLFSSSRGFMIPIKKASDAPHDLLGLREEIFPVECVAMVLSWCLDLLSLAQLLKIMLPACVFTIQLRDFWAVAWRNQLNSVTKHLYHMFHSQLQTRTVLIFSVVN